MEWSDTPALKKVVDFHRRDEMDILNYHLKLITNLQYELTDLKKQVRDLKQQLQEHINDCNRIIKF